MTRREYTEVPYVGGDVSVLDRFLVRSSQYHSRVAVLGASLETSPAGYGNDFSARFNALGRHFFGPGQESLVCGMVAESTRFGVQMTPQTDNGTASNYTLQTLPGLPIAAGSGDLNYTNHAISQLLFEGNPNVAREYQKGTYYEWDPANLRAEFFLATNPSGPQRLRWIWMPHTAAALSTGAPIVQQSATDGHNEPGLQGSANQFVKFQTPKLTSSTWAYPQMIYAGANGSNAFTAGAYMAGMRWLLADDPRPGMGVQCMGAGGLTIHNSPSTGWRDLHGTAYGQFNIYGPWHLLILALGGNDAAGGVSDDTHYTQLHDWIAELRGANWGQADVPILIITDPRIDNDDTGSGGFTAEEYTWFHRQAQVHWEVANELENVCSMNTMRLMEEDGYDPSIQGADDGTNHTADGIHYHPKWGARRAELIMRAMIRHSETGQDPRTMRLSRMAHAVRGPR